MLTKPNLTHLAHRSLIKGLGWKAVCVVVHHVATWMFITSLCEYMGPSLVKLDPCMRNHEGQSQLKVLVSTVDPSTSKGEKQPLPLSQ